MTTAPASDTTGAGGPPDDVVSGGRGPWLARLAVAVVVLLVLVVAILWTLQRGQVLPNTSIVGIDVGGLAADEVASAFSDVARDREQDTVTFTFEDETFELVPSDLGYTIDDEATAAAALARGRTNPVTDVGVRLTSYWTEVDLPLVEVVDRDQLVAAVDAIADEVDRDRTIGSVVADPETLEVTLDEPLGPATVRRDEAVDELAAALLSPGPDELDLPADTEPPTIDPDDAQAVASQLEDVLAEPLVLTGEDESLTLDPQQLAALVEVVTTEDETALELQVTEEQVAEVIGGVAAERFDRDPVSARFTSSRTPPTSFSDMSSTSFSPVAAEAGIEEGRDGRAFDPADAAAQLTAAVRDVAREATTELEVVEADLPNARAEELRPTHLLGTFTTSYTAGQVRNANIHRLADVVDDTVVLPGEQFSINDLSGERTCAKGYQEAGTIVRGELVDTCGGGVSQFGTTTFNAAFFAGVQLDQWQAHSFYISRYPQGREATLSFPALDVRFTNDTDGAIVVRASYTSTTVTVSLYGQPIADVVRASHGEPYDRSSPRTETRSTSSLPAGQTRTIQSAGSGGFKVQVVREVEYVDGSSDSQTITTTYQPQNAIVERGTG